MQTQETMKTLSLFLCLCVGFCLTSCTSDCGNYPALMEEAKGIVEQENPNYEKALEVYTAAIACKPAMSKEVNTAITALFSKINQQRKDACNNLNAFLMAEFTTYMKEAKEFKNLGDVGTPMMKSKGEEAKSVLEKMTVPTDNLSQDQYDDFLAELKDVTGL